ncbi:MAG: hypothetical protein KIS68_12655 [Bauldia sp.]|nr:hypothetical protein [Bauldia sp.]
MRDLIFAVLVQFVGENGAAPTVEELFELAWPEYERNVDLDRPGRGADEFRKKCAYTLRRFERGEIRGAPSIDACVVSYRQRQQGRTGGQARSHASDRDRDATAGERTGAEDSDELITEDRAARIFAQRFKGKLRFCHQTGCWFRWTGTHWARDATGLAYNWARELARDLSIAENDRVRYVTNKTSFASGVEKFAKTDPTLAVTAEVWDSDPVLLGTPAGTVDLRTGQLRGANPAEGISKLVAVAPAHRSDCPHWMRFLDESTAGDSELIRFLQQWAGYCLSGETREHALVFVFGPGGNGKSVFLNTVAGILGDYATSAAMDTFTASRSDRHPTDLAMLRGARLVTATETEEGRSWAEARIKQLTGGDPVTARFMRQDFFTYRPQFKLTIIGNHRPVLASVDDATRRRFRLVPFTVRPTRPDRFLEDRLKEEWPGILRWMIDGCLDWQMNGLTNPAVVCVATDAYFDEQDVFGQWLDEECDLTPESASVWTPAALLYASWRAFAENAGENAGTMKSFVGRLQRAGSMPGRLAGKRVYHGIRLRRQPPKE